MQDVHLPWLGDCSWDDNGDILLAERATLSEQRVIRTLLTNSIERDSDGNTVLPPDDMFHPDFGESLGRDVDGMMTDEAHTDRARRIYTGMAQESTVDQAVSPVVRFQSDPNTNRVITLVEYVTLEGQLVQTGARL
jgi:hypothetical protein